MEIEVLDGPQKGKHFSLKNGLRVGNSSPLSFADLQIPEFHSFISFDSKNSWYIECLAPLKLRLGQAEVPRASLLVGLIFHIGQTGFKVVEKSKPSFVSWEQGMGQWLSRHPGQAVANEIFFFLSLLRLTFIEGIQFEEYYTLSYGPRVLGYNNLDLNIRDPSVPNQVAKFFQIGDQSFIENMAGDRVKLNGLCFDQHLIQNGDKLTVASNVIELSILK